MSRKYRIALASILMVGFAGTAIAADPTTNLAVSHAEAELQKARTTPSSTSKVGPKVLAERSRARKELDGLIDRAKSGQAVDPGAVDALIEAATR